VHTLVDARALVLKLLLITFGRTPPVSQEEFWTAVRLLQQYVELGQRLPLDYTLPSGRSIEALCDRVQSTAVPWDVEQSVRYLAGKLAVTLPAKINYSVVLREIARRLTLPFDQRQTPLIGRPAKRRGQ
jgi:hypothetical protein